jgi:phenylpropionate dioxygenase-like ring-hydroxylating dioxygenase large terminal subunit
VHRVGPTRLLSVIHSAGFGWVTSRQNADDIPDYGVLDGVNPAYISERDYLVVDADYRVITDNLLDLSHVPLLHRGSAQRSVDDAVEVVQAGTRVSISRWAYDVPVPTLFDALFRNDGRNVDSWTEMHWMPVGCMILDTGGRKPGVPKESGSGYFGLHILTPESSRTTHYHFAAVRFNPPPRAVDEDAATREKISTLGAMRLSMKTSQ